MTTPPAMTIALALRRGIAALNAAWPLCVLWYAVTTGIALCIAAGFLAIGFDSLGASAWAQDLAGNLSLQWPAELLAKYGADLAVPVLAVLSVLGSLALLAYLFLLGGAIQLFCTRERFSMQSFFAGCGRNFGRLAKLTLISLIFYGAVLLIGAALAWLGAKFWENGNRETPLVYWAWFRLAVLTCLFGFVNAVFDYARIRAIAGDGRKIWRTSLGSFLFVWRNPGPTLGLYAALWIIALAMLAAYSAASRVLTQSSVFVVLLLLGFRQITVLAKIWSRLLFYAAQCEMAGALWPPLILVAPEPEAELEALPDPAPGPPPQQSEPDPPPVSTAAPQP